MTDNPLTQFNIDPQVFEVTTEYAQNLSITQTAANLHLSEHQVVEILENKAAKRYIDAIFMEQGYMQRNKLNDVMTKIIDMKLEEMEESELGSNKDILEILKQAHTMQMDHQKASKEEQPGQQVNIQNNFGGDNYNKLLEKIVAGE